MPLFTSKKRLFSALSFTFASKHVRIRPATVQLCSVICHSISRLMGISYTLRIHLVIYSSVYSLTSAFARRNGLCM